MHSVHNHTFFNYVPALNTFVTEHSCLDNFNPLEDFYIQGKRNKVRFTLSLIKKNLDNETEYWEYRVHSSSRNFFSGKVKVFND